MSGTPSSRHNSIIADTPDSNPTISGYNYPPTEDAIPTAERDCALRAAKTSG